MKLRNHTTVKKFFIKVVRTGMCLVAGCIAFILLYFVAFLLLSNITIHNGFEQSDTGIDIYLLSNGVHTDIVVPVKNECKDWRTEIDCRLTKAQDSTMRYLAVGWGDKGFYLGTPTWADLRFSVAFRAVFGLSSSAMHTTFYKTMEEDALCQRIRINREQYLKIISCIEKQFQHNPAGGVILISGAPSYGYHDSFYEAKERYNLFFTCNSWANQCLKQAGIKACVWTPFNKGLFLKRGRDIS